MSQHAVVTEIRRGPHPVASVQGTLALEYGARPSTSRAPDLRLVPAQRDRLEAFAHRFAHVLVEVLSGDRGPQQLVRWTSTRVYEQLQQRDGLLQLVTPTDRRVRRLRSQVRSVHLFYPTAEAVELSIHVREGHRSRAVAARLELEEQRWRCTALQLG